MNTLTEYDLTTGEITTAYSFPEGEEDSVVQREGFGYVEGFAHGDAWYVLDGVITERPASPVIRANLTLLNVPTGSKLWVNGESFDAEDEVELEIPLPGTYSLRVECFPYLNFEEELRA